ncbi:hypothetical protein BC835DRAFT_1381031, partial [Cytidiella melzeri]
MHPRQCATHRLQLPCSFHGAVDGKKLSSVSCFTINTAEPALPPPALRVPSLLRIYLSFFVPANSRNLALVASLSLISHSCFATSTLKSITSHTLLSLGYPSSCALPPSLSRYLLLLVLLYLHPSPLVPPPLQPWLLFGTMLTIAPPCQLRECPCHACTVAKRPHQHHIAKESRVSAHWKKSASLLMVV